MPGLKVAGALGVGLAVALAFWGAAWAGGVLVGLSAVGLGRLVHARLVRWALTEGRRSALVAAALGRSAVAGGLALAGVAAGAAPLAVALGLFLVPVGLWLELGFHVLRNR